MAASNKNTFHIMPAPSAKPRIWFTAHGLGSAYTTLNGVSSFTRRRAVVRVMAFSIFRLLPITEISLDWPNRESDHNLTDKYATFQGMARIEKKFCDKLGNTNLETIEKSIDYGSVKQGDNASPAVLVTDVLMDLGLVRESNAWRVDQHTVKSVIEGGFLKEWSDCVGLRELVGIALGQRNRFDPCRCKTVIGIVSVVLSLSFRKTGLHAIA